MRFANISRPSKTVGSPQLITLVISDVPGDNPSIVASGPTVRIRALLPMLRRSSCGSAWPCPHWLRLILGDALEGESRKLGTIMAGIARSVRTHVLAVAPPAVLLSGGETTVTIRRDGAGK